MHGNIEMAGAKKAKQPPVGAKISESERVTAAMLRTVRKVEREAGDGGTGYTIIKRRSSPIARLLDDHRIGPDELQAAGDIETAFHAIAGALMFRPLNLERSDRSHSQNEPARIVDAVARYREWADVWSKRSKRGDPTLAIVVGAVVHDEPFRLLEAIYELRNGLAARAVIAGLRDYAARAGWLSQSGLVENGGIFKLKRPVGRRRQEALMRVAAMWDNQSAP